MTSDRRHPIERVSGPLRKLTDHAAAGGIVLVISATCAFV